MDLDIAQGGLTGLLRDYPWKVLRPHVTSIKDNHIDLSLRFETMEDPRSKLS